MKRSNKFRAAVRPFAVALAAALAWAGCTDVDDSLGGNLIPENQQMKAGYAVFDGSSKVPGLSPRKYVESRLFQTDSIAGSKLANGYMGSMANDTVGVRTAGFLSQFTSYYKVEEGDFGYKPIFDSAYIFLSINGYGTDTLTDQRFAVYEVTDDKYLKESTDTIFYITFDPEAEGIVGEKLFTFSLGQSNQTGPATTAVTMDPTEAGRRFINRLLLEEGDYAGDYSIYQTDSLSKWFEAFKGLYIRPEQDMTSETGATRGTIYSTELASSGFMVYGRSRREDNPSLIKDTIGMGFYFNIEDAPLGNVAINTVRHDYTGALIPVDEAREKLAERPQRETLYVEGLGGVVSELTFTRELFEELEQILAVENAASGKSFRTFAFSQVRMSIYLPGSDYDWQKIDPANAAPLVALMNGSLPRLGLYTDYKKLTPVADYAYAYEQQGTTLAYDGNLNRSRACYVMNITSYMQALWNRYVRLRDKTPEGEEVDLTELANRSVYLAPEAYSLFSLPYSVIQGEAGTENNAPVRLDMTYNMIQ